MSILDYLFPPQQSQIGGLLGIDEEKMRRQAQQAGLLNAGLGIIAASGPSRMPQGLLQPVAAGLMAGQQAYQGTLEQQMQQAAAAQKMRQEQETRNLMSQAFVPQYTERPGTQTAIPSDIGPAVIETPATREITGYNLDINRVAPQLAMRGRPDLVKSLAETQALIGGKPAELSPQQQQYAQARYGTTNFNQLPKQAQEDVIAFGQIPKSDEAFKNLIAANELYYKSGIGGDLVRKAEIEYELSTGKRAPSSREVASVIQSTQTPTGTAVRPEQPQQQSQRKAIAMVDSPSLPLQKRQELLLVKPQEMAATTSISSRMRDINDLVDGVLKNEKGLKAATGFGGGSFSMLSGTEAANARRDLESIKSLISLAEISKMRAESKTGGAVGNMTEKEWPRFEVLSGSLEQDQTYDKVVKNLKNLKNLTKETQDSMLRKYDSIYGGADEITSVVDRPKPVEMTSIPTGAVQMLRQNPSKELQDLFDKKYGKGAAAQVLQGNR